MTKAATALLKYSSSDQKRELANRMMRQRVARAPFESISGPAALEDAAIPESHYRLDQHPAYLNLLARMAELEPPEIGGGPYFRFHQGLVRGIERNGVQEVERSNRFAPLIDLSMKLVLRGQLGGL